LKLEDQSVNFLFNHRGKNEFTQCNTELSLIKTLRDSVPHSKKLCV